MLRAVLCAVALTASLPAAASGGDANANAGQPTQAKPVREKKVCRVDRSSVGTILPQRVCHTATEWQQIEAQSGVRQQQRVNAQDVDNMMGNIPH